MIDVIIVNWNSGELLQNCIESIVTEDNLSLVNQIFIIDNNSADASMDNISEHEKVRIVYNDENKGFAKAVNQGFRLCTADFVLLLNPDTQLYPDTLKASVNFLAENPGVDIMGCQLLNGAGKIAPSCARFPTPLRFVSDSFGLPKIFPAIFKPALLMEDWDHKESRFVDQVMGAFMFMQRKIFDTVGYFDEQFFVYYEELDFSKRLAAVGGKTFFNSSIQILHLGKGTTSSVKAYRLFLNLSSRMKYAKKHFSKFGYFIVLLNVWSIEPFTRSLFSIFTGQGKEVKNILKGYQLLLKNKVDE